MLIIGVDMNIKLTRTPEAFYLLATTDDTKVRNKILDATLFITQVELKPPLLLAHPKILAMIKHTILSSTLKSRLLQRLSKSLLKMHSLGRCQTGLL